MTAVTIRRRELEAMELAEKYREENRALRQVIEVQAERILALTALLPTVDVPSAQWDSGYVNPGSTTITTPSDGGIIYYPALAAGVMTVHGHGTDALGRPIPMGCACSRCVTQIT